MRVYELMSILSEMNSGMEVKVNVCMTTEELEEGDDVGDGLFSKTLKISGMDGYGYLSTGL